MARPRVYSGIELLSCNIYLNPEQEEWLQKFAHDNNRSRSAVVRALIDLQRYYDYIKALDEKFNASIENVKQTDPTTEQNSST